MKRAVLYLRVSTLDQHPETQLLDLRQMAAQRGFEIVREYTDRISGAKTRRPGLDEMMRDARRGRFEVVLVWASDRIARSVKHFLEVLDELNRLNIEFVSFREQIDTGGPLGRAVVVIIGAIAELERNLIIERVRAGMRRARLEGLHIGRRPLELDHHGPAGQEPRRLPHHCPPRAPRACRNHTGEIRMTLIKTLIFAGFSLAVGLALGNELRRRRSAEDRVEELRSQLKHARGPLPERQLKEIRGVLNDAHKHIVAVTKALEKRAS